MYVCMPECMYVCPSFFRRFLLVICLYLVCFALTVVLSVFMYVLRVLFLLYVCFSVLSCSFRCFLSLSLVVLSSAFPFCLPCVLSFCLVFFVPFLFVLPALGSVVMFVFLYVVFCACSVFLFSNCLLLFLSVSVLCCLFCMSLCRSFLLQFVHHGFVLLFL